MSGPKVEWRGRGEGSLYVQDEGPDWSFHNFIEKKGKCGKNGLISE